MTFLDTKFHFQPLNPFKDHLWSWLNHPDHKLLLIARHAVLQTQMAKLCCAIKTTLIPNMVFKSQFSVIGLFSKVYILLQHL